MSDAPDTVAEEAAPEADDLERWASDLAAGLDANGYTVEFDTVRIHVDADRWVETIVAAWKDLPLFSWLSAIDWARDVAVGEGVEDPDSLEERFEVICRLSSVEDAHGAQFVATLSKDDPTIGSLTPHIGGAAWHEREAHEMFGIAFEGNANLAPLYLPDDFVGHPLLKSYPLIAREVKPWPGDVDVEDMPASPADESTGESGDDEEGDAG
jgi:NADH-quinone oxidoreductase subunit C